MIAAIIFGLLFGIGEAVKDFRDIMSYEIAPGIVHGWRFWLNRAVRFVIPCLLILWLFDGAIVLPFLAAACIATSVHRYTLNRLRTLNGSYISTSNGYDRFWLNWFGANGGELAYITEITAAVAIIITHYV